VEALATLASFILELVAWAVLFLVELLVALLTWRKPRKVARPVFWRSRKGRSIAPENAASGEPREGRHDA
jgi:hypothetical protein